MLIKQHAIASTVVAGGLWLITDSWQMAVASLISGVIVDIDHTVEYAVEHGFSLDIKRFIRLVFEAKYKRVFYLLHSWEWFIAGLVMVWATGWNVWGVGLMVGYGQHLVLDQVGNRGTLGSYSLVWRWKRGFDHARCFPARADDLSD